MHVVYFKSLSSKFPFPLQVCKDVRSDIESSSEEEADAPADALKASHAPRGENGTNGHCTAARPRTHNHSGC